MAKWIAAEGSRAVLWILKDLLTLGAKGLNSLKRGVQVVNVEVQVHRRPMTIELAPVIGIWRRLRTGGPFKETELNIQTLQYGKTRHGL